jgi:hypothetical protein
MCSQSESIPPVQHCQSWTYSFAAFLKAQHLRDRTPGVRIGSEEAR